MQSHLFLCQSAKNKRGLMNHDQKCTPCLVGNNLIWVILINNLFSMFNHLISPRAYFFSILDAFKFIFIMKYDYYKRKRCLLARLQNYLHYHSIWLILLSTFSATNLFWQLQLCNRLCILYTICGRRLNTLYSKQFAIGKCLILLCGE